jgi:hypothetical protein
MAYSTGLLSYWPTILLVYQLKLKEEPFEGSSLRLFLRLHALLSSFGQFFGFGFGLFGGLFGLLA